MILIFDVRNSSKFMIEQEFPPNRLHQPTTIRGMTSQNSRSVRLTDKKSQPYNTAEEFFISSFRAQQVYRKESLHPTVYLVAAAVLKENLNETPCIN